MGCMLMFLSLLNISVNFWKDVALSLVVSAIPFSGFCPSKVFIKVVLIWQYLSALVDLSDFSDFVGGFVIQGRNNIVEL